MAVWYEVEKSEAGINDFLDCNWGFHDFRPELVSQGRIWWKYF